MGTPYFNDFAQVVCMLNLGPGDVDQTEVPYNIRGGSIALYDAELGRYAITLDQAIGRDELFVTVAGGVPEDDIAVAIQVSWIDSTHVFLSTRKSGDPLSEAGYFITIGRMLNGQRGTLVIE